MRKAEDLIQTFLDSIGQSEGSHYARMFRSWKEIVGERIAAHTQPVDVRGNSLVVEADHPGWVQMVMMKRAHILKQLKRRVPEITITGISIRVHSADSAGSDSASGAPKGRSRGSGSRGARQDGSTRYDGDAPPPEFEPPVPSPPSADEKEALERIEDDDMRSTLERLREDLER